MKEIKKIIAYLLVAALVITILPFYSAKAEATVITGQCGKDAYYEYDAEKVLRITGTGEIDTYRFTDLVDAGIKDEIEKIVMDRHITSIADEAFMGFTALKEVEMSCTTTSIGQKAFAQCTSLKSISIPKRTEFVSDYAFMDCTALEDVYLLAWEGTIEENAFYNCKNIKRLFYAGDDNKLTIPSKWPVSLEKVYSYSGDNAYDYAINNDVTHVNILAYVDSHTVSQPVNGINYIGFVDGTCIVFNIAELDDLGSNGNYAENIVIGTGITAIKSGALMNYKLLESIVIPESVTSIESSAFKNDISLKEITLPIGVPEIQSGTFVGCTSLTTMTVKNPELVFNEKGMPENLETLYGYAGSTAESYASEHGINFVAIDSKGGTEVETTEEITTEAETTVPETTTEPVTTVPETTTEEVTTILETTTEQVTIVPETTTEEETTVPETTTEEVTTVPETTTEEITTVPETTTEEVTTVPDTTTELETTTEIETTTIDSVVVTPQTTKNEQTTNKTNIKPTTTNKINEKQTAKTPTKKSTSKKAKITLKKVKIKKIKEKNYHTVKITWKKTAGATTYKVYRSTKKKGKYKLIKTVTKKKYTDKKVKAGKKYFYKIKAVGKNGASSLSKAKKIKVKGAPNKPSIKVTKNKSTWSIVWGVVKDNSKGIEIYMKNGKKYVLINKTTKLKKSNKKKGVTGISSSMEALQAGVTYKFKARTYALVKGKKVYSKWSNVKTLKK